MTATPAQAFTAWCAFLGPIEGGFSNNPADPGNWTSGTIGVGELKGTKFGIAASSHYDLDIANLTLEQANAIRKREYWDAIEGDMLHPSVAFVLADAAYGSAPVRAIEQLQDVLKVKADGVIGKQTQGAIAQAIAAPSALGLPSGLDDLLTEYAAHRLLFEASLPTWFTFDGGWTRRLFRSLVVARTLA